jgi:hypothetical protein
MNNHNLLNYSYNLQIVPNELLSPSTMVHLVISGGILITLMTSKVNIINLDTLKDFQCKDAFDCIDYLYDNGFLIIMINFEMVEYTRQIREEEVLIYGCQQLTSFVTFHNQLVGRYLILEL